MRTAIGKGCQQGAVAFNRRTIPTDSLSGRSLRNAYASHFTLLPAAISCLPSAEGKMGMEARKKRAQCCSPQCHPPGAQAGESRWRRSLQKKNRKVLNHAASRQMRFVPKVVSHSNHIFWVVLYFLIRNMIFLFWDIFLQIWTCGLRSWVTWWDILKKLLDSEQEFLGMQSLVVCLFKCLWMSQHFNLETATRLHSTRPWCALEEVRQPTPSLTWALTYASK